MNLQLIGIGNAGRNERPFRNKKSKEKKANNSLIAILLFIKTRTGTFFCIFITRALDLKEEEFQYLHITRRLRFFLGTATHKRE